jgi:hypothetical protein
VKIARNIKAISKILFILLLLLALVIGSIFSYLLIVGYYITLDIRVPVNTTISVLDVAFNPQDSETFNITILNPTYSPTQATITEIYVATEDDIVYKISDVNPQLPFDLDKGQDETFVCRLNLGEHSGENVKLMVLVEDGSGSAYEFEITPVKVIITGTVFTTDDTQHFDVTISNPDDSTINLDLTRIAVTMDNETFFEVSEITPTIPRVLSPGILQAFRCSWDWTYYRGRNATISVFTYQGYTASRIATTPKPVQLSIAEINVDSSNTTYFNVTVTNSEHSIISANITSIKLNLEDETTVEVVTESPSLPYTLSIGETVTLKCLWDWTDRRGEGVIVVVDTSEGYFGQSEIYVIG